MQRRNSEARKPGSWLDIFSAQTIRGAKILVHGSGFPAQPGLSGWGEALLVSIPGFVASELILIRQNDFGVATQICIETTLEPGDDGRWTCLFPERPVKQGGDFATVIGGKRGKPLLLHRVTFIAGKAVHAFQIHD